MRPASEQLLQRIAERLKAMADPMRLKILHTINDGERCVSDILAEVGGSQANVSKHLSVLRRAGLVECRRDGVNVYYAIADQTVFSICRSVCDSMEKRLDAERAGIRAGRAAIVGNRR
jgi:ArsR family transcriptional regulator